MTDVQPTSSGKRPLSSAKGSPHPRGYEIARAEAPITEVEN